MIHLQNKNNTSRRWADTKKSEELKDTLVNKGEAEIFTLNILTNTTEKGKNK